MAYTIINVPDDASTQLEQLGTKAKFWFRNDKNKPMLFKQGRPETGENWAEKVCCEICTLLRLPHAKYDLATWRSKEGVVTPTFVPKNSRLIHGNELLAKFNDDYDITLTYSSNQHTLRRVMALLKLLNLQEPIGWNYPTEINNVTDIFTGYLLLDALTGNQDRHHENWGIISSINDGLSLAPTFDHASSLGRNETDKNRLERLNSNDRFRSVDYYVTRARSGLYPSDLTNKAYTTLEAFLEIAKINVLSGRYWLEQLKKIQVSDFEFILAQIPDTQISGAARKFALKMLQINKNRLLEERRHL